MAKVQLTTRQALGLVIMGLQAGNTTAALDVLKDMYEQCPEGVLYPEILYTHLKNATDAVVGLIEESQGVAGLHQNGEIAEWSTLLRGGAYEEWLLPLCDALDFLKEGEDATLEPG